MDTDLTIPQDGLARIRLLTVAYAIVAAGATAVHLLLLPELTVTAQVVGLAGLVVLVFCWWRCHGRGRIPVVGDVAGIAALLAVAWVMPHVAHVTWVFFAWVLVRSAFVAGRADVLVAAVPIPVYVLLALHAVGWDVAGFVTSSRLGPAIGMAALLALNVVTTRTLIRKSEVEEQLRQASRLEAVGRLAAGIAHDFNNLLTAIKGHTALLADELPADEPRRAALADIDGAVDRGADLVRQLLAYARKQRLEPEAVRLNQEIRGMTPLLRRLLREDIRLRLDISGADPWVRVDRSQLDQVILNLAANARDAMPDGGHLTIVTEATTLGDHEARDRDIRPGRYARILVRDNGEGMVPEVLEHIFEPFYSGREFGERAGLGLATVYGIIRQSGGAIDVRSRPGRGTTFEILLPRVTPERDDRADADSPTRQVRRRVGEASVPRGVAALVEGDAPNRGLTVLLVEDEDAVRQFAARVLRRSGYRVLDVGSAEAARTAVQGEPDAVDVLVTDVVLPGASGPELAAALRRDRPELPVLYISGYAPDELGRRHPDTPLDAPLLQKPFEIDAFVGAVDGLVTERSLDVA